MPTYNYTCSKCEHTFDKILKISDRMSPETQPCPECSSEGTVHYCISSPKIVSGVGSILSKTDDGWKETLSKIKSKHLINNIKT